MRRDITIFDIEFPATNILNLPNPEEFSCYIYKYEPWSLFLTVQSYHISPQKLYLSFGDIQYIEGPFRWKGANLCTAPDSDYTETISKLSGKLFIIPCASFKVKIVANFLSISDTYDDLHRISQ